MVCPVRLLICCTSAPCSQLLHSGLFFVYVDSDPRSLLISFFVILGVACHVFDLCWFWLCTFFDPLLLFFWDGPSAKGVWRLPNVHTVNCRWSSPHCACYAVSVRVNMWIVDVCDDTVTFPVGIWLRGGRLVSFWDMTLLLFQQAWGNAILVLGPL